MASADCSEYMCPRCGYLTTFASHIRRHLRRRVPCSPTYCVLSCEDVLAELFANDKKPFRCSACDKGFTTRRALILHTRSKHLLLGEDEVKHDFASSSSSSSSSSSLDELAQLRQLQLEVRELRSLLLAKATRENGGNSSSSGAFVNVQNCRNLRNVGNTTNTVVNNLGNTTNIVINAFGNESMNHISSQFLDRCVRRRDKGLVELIEKIHYDPGHSENRNVKLTNKKETVVMIHDGEGWRFEMKELVVKALVEKGHSIMQEHFDDHEDRLRQLFSETMLAHITEWLEKMHDEDKRTMRTVLNGLYVLLLNASRSSSPST